MQDTVTSAFDSATRFGNTLEPYRQFYQENESLDLEDMKTKEHGMTINLVLCHVIAHIFENEYHLARPRVTMSGTGHYS